jgi:hypothetical protein
MTVDNRLFMVCGSENVTFSEPEGSFPTMRIIAYNGGKMVTNRGAVVVDLNSIRIPKKIAILADHDNSTNGIVGHGEASVENGKVVVNGVVSSAHGYARDLAETAKRGYPFQASIGVRDFSMEPVKRGDTAIVNGQTVEGPVAIVRGGELYETSLVPFGADSQTSVCVAQWPDEQAEGDMTMEKEPVAAGQVDQAAVESMTAQAVAKALEVERKRIAEIDEVCAQHAKLDLAEKRKEAIEGKVSLVQLKDFILAQYRSSAPKAEDVAAPAVHQKPVITAQAIEAALLASAGMPESKIAAQYSERDMEQAHKMAGIGLQGAVIKACQLDSVRLPDTFGWHGDKLKATASSISLPGILGNVLNKILLSEYEKSMGVVMGVCGHKAVSDFKAVYSYRPNESMEFEEVGADGELKSVSFSENTMSNQARTYGKYIQLTRQMLINDDLDYFASVPRKLGQGGAQCVEKTVVKLLLANGNVTDKTLSAQGVPASSTAAFFSSTWGNLLTGSSYALAITTGWAGWEAARLKMRLQKDHFGEPINLSPTICLVPPELETYAIRLASSEMLAIAGDTDQYSVPTYNQFRGMNILVSPYLSLSTLTGYSTTAYYMACNPAIIEGVQLAWLNNVRAPVIESVDVRSEVLGTAWRSYLDFGAALQDPRAMVKVAGV